MAVEWGEMVLTALGSDHLLVRIRFEEPVEGQPSDPDVRRVEVHLSGESWAGRNPVVRSAVSRAVDIAVT